MANFDQKSLKALKKQLTEQTMAEKAVKQASVKKEKLQLEDENFFLNAMDGVNPLEFSNAVHEPVKAKSKPIQYDDFEDEPLNQLYTKSGSIEFTGFHTIDLDSDIQLAAGEDFLCKMQFII